MHFYQKKHGRLLALLVLLLTQVHIAFQKNNFSKLSAVRDDLFALRISDPKLNSLSTAAEEGRDVFSPT
jgi:hypothetical protein